MPSSACGGCCERTGKIVFRDKQEAMGRLSFLKQRGYSRDAHAYICRYCEGWHVGRPLDRHGAPKGQRVKRGEG